MKRFELQNKQTLNKALGYSPLYSFLEYDGWDVVSRFDDFLGSELTNAVAAGDPGLYTEKTGSDGAIDILASQPGGVAELRASDGSGSDQEYGMAFSGLHFKGDLYAGMAVRVALDAITTVRVELGFTDSMTSDAMIIKDGDLNTIGDGDDNGMNADDAVFWAMDTDETSDDWHHAGVKATEEIAVVDSGITAVAGTFETFGIQLIGDTATFFRLDTDGKLTYKETYEDAIEGGTAVSPFVGIQLKTGADRNLHIDYWAEWQRRTTSS